MAQSGLHIPTNESSSIYIFDNVFADIGDEQSILESLSTFSSHITNIVEIFKNATPDSLVLLDELGAGTDPKEGANLAISILEELHKKNILNISTTHFPELKNYALTNSGFQNASFEFDLENLKPTYKLLVGIPGKSNAFDICKKLGLNAKILDNAKARLSEEDINIETLLKSIYDDKVEIEKNKEEISKNLVQIEALREKLETDYSEAESKSEKIIVDAKTQARDILLAAKSESTDIIKSAKKIYNNLGKDSIKDLDNLRNQVNTDIRALNQNEKVNIENFGLHIEEIEIGMKVFVPAISNDGIILTKPNKSGEVQIQFGTMKTVLPISSLVKIKNVKTQKQEQKLYFSSQKSKTISSEINVIGLNVEEAVAIIDKYLDDAKVAKLETIRIVHGKGTGKLRLGIHKFLKSHPHVKDFRIGTYGEGEMGVTVVTIK